MIKTDDSPRPGCLYTQIPPCIICVWHCLINWFIAHMRTYYLIRMINNSPTMFMVLSSWQSHCESSPGSFDECRKAPSGRRPKTKPDDLGCESACTGCQSLHPPSPFIVITQPKSWYSFYCPMQCRRLSRPSWLVTYWDGLSTHPGTNRVWRSAVTLIEANTLPLSQTT